MAAHFAEPDSTFPKEPVADGLGWVRNATGIRGRSGPKQPNINVGKSVCSSSDLHAMVELVQELVGRGEF